MTQSKQSDVAKSLEKIAIEKGLIKVEKFKKVAEVASKLPKTKPTDNLSENVIKLCDALRGQGFNKYADDVEEKFLLYTKAQYNVTGETGDNLVESAHPDGSHKLSDMEGDSVIEDILEKHKKIQQITEKQPTGKLAAKDAKNIVKILLAQELVGQSAPTLADIKSMVFQAYSMINGAINSIMPVASTAAHMDPTAPSAHPWLSTALSGFIGTAPIGGILQMYSRWKDGLQVRQQELNGDFKDWQKDSSGENLQSLINKAGDIESFLNNMPSGTDALKTQALKAMSNGITILNNASNSLGLLGSAPTDSQTTPQAQTGAPAATQVSPAVQQYNALLQKIYDSTKVNREGKIAINNWLEKNKPDLQHDPQASQKLTQIEQSLIQQNLI